jgi:DNA-binding helix-hairpin-helix protein with protein kinase domain
LLLLFLGAAFGATGRGETGMMLALFAIAPLAVLVGFTLWWVVQESTRKELQSEANREYDAELVALQEEADRKLARWQNKLADRQRAAREQFKQSVSQWEEEIRELQREARMRYEQEVARWKSIVEPIQAEAKRRRNTMENARKRVDAAEREWKAAATKFVADFDNKKKHLKQLRDRHEELGRQYVTERQQLQSRVKETQLVQFLQLTFLSDHKIPDIGRGRSATLSSYGIETALDIEESKVSAVPGFGEVLTGRLVEWRRSVEARFVFNPSAGVPQQQQQSLDAKFSPERQRIEMTLLSGERELKVVASACETALASRYEEIKASFKAIAQANADLTEVPSGV